MKPVRFHPAAEVELAAEARYYEERSPGLGERFVREVEAAVRLASAFPQIGPPYRYDTRRVFPKSFAFSIVYRPSRAGS
ncbi:MAG: type II toxin-antitoxin system RelE/ParE family toxin [Burkholderiaceae bacterium]|nr:type II toxin-antitoxin system RelE/ParE family toxin [Burkholderiaceae bacterium]